ncbi:MAG: hypothetical protein WCZ18_07365 [Ottowia sp.]|nr:hypothetical protein [Ottowia sp.]
MKKLALTAVAAATMLAAGAANAYTSGTFSNGFVVPNVIHNGVGYTTTVGITNAGDATSVWWTFFDQDSGHVTDGCFPMTANDYYQYIWSSESGVGLENKRGYLVFASGPDDECTDSSGLSEGGLIGGHAFQVDVPNDDVAYTPVIDGDLTITGDLSTMGPDSLTEVAGAAPVGDILYMHYYIDGAPGGTDTRIFVWSTGDQSGTHTVNMYDDNQNRKSVNFELKFEELDNFNPETIAGRPADYTDGFIVWDTGTAPDLDTTGSVFSYSEIAAPGFGAVQSVLGLHTPAPSAP